MDSKDSTSLEDAVAQAVSRARDVPSRVSKGDWTVRIITAQDNWTIRLSSQAQVGLIALDLQRLGFSVDVDHELNVDVLCVHKDAQVTTD